MYNNILTSISTYTHILYIFNIFTIENIIIKLSMKRQTIHTYYHLSYSVVHDTARALELYYVLSSLPLLRIFICRFITFTKTEIKYLS
jgi:hypothetical protein